MASEITITEVSINHLKKVKLALFPLEIKLLFVFVFQTERARESKQECEKGQREKEREYPKQGLCSVRSQTRGTILWPDIMT